MMDVAIYLTGIVSGIGLVAGLYFGAKAFTRYRKLHEMDREIHHRRVLNMYGWQDYAYVPPMMFSNEKEVELAFVKIETAACTGCDLCVQTCAPKAIRHAVPTFPVSIN